MATKVVLADAPISTDKIVRLKLVEYMRLPTLVTVDESGEIDLYLASVDENGLHLFCGCQTSGLKTSGPDTFVKVSRDR